MFFIIFILLLNCLNFLYYSAKSWFLFVKTKKAEFFLIRNCYFYWLQMQSGECSVVAPHSPPWKFSTFEVFFLITFEILCCGNFSSSIKFFTLFVRKYFIIHLVIPFLISPFKGNKTFVCGYNIEECVIFSKKLIK